LVGGEIKDSVVDGCFVIRDCLGEGKNARVQKVGLSPHLRGKGMMSETMI